MCSLALSWDRCCEPGGSIVVAAVVAVVLVRSVDRALERSGDRGLAPMIGSRRRSEVVTRRVLPFVIIILTVLNTGCASTPAGSLQSAPSGGFATGSWEAVVGLFGGQDIAVKLTTGGVILGTFEAADPNSLTMRLQFSSSMRVIEKAAVQSIDARVSEPSTKFKYTLRGAMIGAGAALGFLVLVCEVGGTDCSVVQNGPIFSSAAAAIGALWGRAFGRPPSVRTVRVYSRQ